MKARRLELRMRRQTPGYIADPQKEVLRHLKEDFHEFLRCFGEKHG